MSKPLLDDLPPTTGEGNIINESFRKSNVAHNLVNDYAASLEERLVRQERLSAPAGTSLGPSTAAFAYPAIQAPTSMPSRGTALMGGSTSVGPDTDGKFGLAVLTPTRLVTVAASGAASTVGPSQATSFDLDGTGKPFQLVSASFGPGPYPAGGGAVSTFAIVGTVATGTSSLRVAAGAAGTNPFAFYSSAVTTLSVDPTTGALSATVDYNTTGAFLPTVGTHSRRGFLCGGFGAFFARYVNVTGLDAGAARNVALLDTVERIGGSGSRWVRPVGQALGVAQLAVDRITDTLFACLMDNSGPGGTSASAALHIVHVDDLGAGVVSVLRMGNALSGSPRLRSLDEELVVGTYTSGASTATYAWAVDPATGASRLIGAGDVSGLLGSVPVDIFRVSPTRFVAFYKTGANWAVQARVYEVNLAAGAGVSPFSQISAFTFNLGEGEVAGAVTGDAVTLGAIEEVVPGRYAFAFRNATRTANALQIRDFAA